MLITDSKQVYSEFKFLKDVKTRINISERIIFIPSSENKITINFSYDSPFYRLYGEIEGETEFIKWINSGHSCEVKLEDINILSKCLKKNVISIEYDDEEFKFNFIPKDSEENVSIVFRNDRNLKSFESPLKEFLEYSFSKSELDDDLLRVYRNGDELTINKTDCLLLEAPKSTLLSIQPKSESVKFRFTKDFNAEKKYVEVESKYESLKLVQLFAVI